MKRLQPKVHELWLLMLHGKDYDEHDVLEMLLVHAEEASCAVLDNVHHKGEEALAEVSVELEVIFHDGKSAFAEALVDHWQLIVQLFAHVLDHRREQVKDLGVTGILGICFVVVYQQLELR